MFTRPFQGPRGRDAAFLAACLILAVAVVPGAVLRGEVLSHSQLLFEHAPWQGHAPANVPPVNPFLVDPPLVFYPFLATAVDSVRHWQLPVWSPGLYAGHPFLASFQTAVLSPFMLLAYVIPLPWATVPLALAPLVVGAIGMRRLVQALGGGEAASWYAGLAWLLNGFAIVWIEHPLTAVACWVPWIMLAIDRLVSDPNARRAAWLALAIGASILSGHPETTLKVLLFTAFWGLYCAWRSPPSTWVLLAAGGVAGALLAAIQVIPFAEYLGLSEALARRNAAGGNTFVLPPETLVTALVPDFFGNPAHGAYLERINRFGIAANYGEQQVYAGAATALLAPLGLVVAWRHTRARFLAGAACLALALMYGMPGLLAVVSRLPVLRVSILSRFGVVAIACAILLAARAVDVIAGDRAGTIETGRSSRPALGVLAIGIVLLATIAISYETLGTALARIELLERTRRACMAAAGVLSVTALIAWLSLERRLRGGVAGAALCMLVTGELLVQAQGFHRTIAPRSVLPVVPAIEAVRRDPGLFRVYGWGTALLPNTGMVYGFQDARGWDGVQPARYTRLLDLGYLRQSRDPARHLASPILLDLLNVKYVFVPKGLQLPAPRFVPVPDAEGLVYENRLVQPRAWLAADYRVMGDREMEGALHGHLADLRRIVLLERELESHERPTGRAEPSDVAIVRQYRDRLVEIETTSPGRRLLVLADAAYPGWRARVDGQDVRVYRADYAVRAVSVPPGRHVVRFTYEPWTLRVGAAISIFVACGIAATLITARGRSSE